MNKGLRKLGEVLFSRKLTLIALVLFAVSMGYATFLENDFGTPVARGAVYDAWWFELLMFILGVNFAGNIYRYNLLSRQKLPILMFHLAFIVILIGAFITRYTGYEGLVRIREGQSTNKIISQKRYFKIQLEDNQEHWHFEKGLAITRFKQPAIEEELGHDENPLKISVTKFVPDAMQGIVDGVGEDEVIELVSSSEGDGRQSYLLEKGGSIFLNNHQITFQNEQEGAINILKINEDYTINSSEDLSFMIMSTQEAGTLPKDSTDRLNLRALYRSDHINFVVSAIHPGKTIDYITTEDKNMANNAADLLFVSLTYKSEHREVILAALDGVYSPPQSAHMGPYHLQLSYGPEIIEMPFSLRLDDFQLERYPGSTSPSSYASELTVEDPESSFPYRISMNNVLDHDGFRFFQASYDMDEKGTVLSVNKDFLGTQVTYLGYTLMGLGMILTLFGKNSRFRFVARQLKTLKAGAGIFTIMAMTTPGLAQTEDIAELSVVDKAHAKKFGALLVQDMDGRIKPLNTLSSEFLRKLTRSTTYTLDASKNVKLNSDQLFLAVHQNPILWQNIPLIIIDQEKGAGIFTQLGIEPTEMFSFRDLLNFEGDYKMRLLAEMAQRKKPAERSEFDNEILKVDERFNILYQALSGNYLKIFPQKEHPENKWFNDNFINAGFTAEDSLFVRNILGSYYAALQKAAVNEDYTEADDLLLYIKTFQDTMGAAVIPAESRVRAELLYNRLNVFNRIWPFFWFIGVYLLIIALVKVFSDSTGWSTAYLIGIILTFIGFLILTANMILRWYAADYPPWSNGYEMIILVAWALFLFGFIFYRQSDFIMPLVALFGGTLLFVSFLDWLNPEITSLVPVLKSYWLKIHVAIIVSSYAPLALSALLGLLAMIFMVSGSGRFGKPIKELTYINELSMTIGLFMLAIGTFLGGVWANESWGRYWGWDPKETWALISVVIYAAVLHMRLVPGLRGDYVFSLASVFAFFSIIMTSFGVNYYLAGLHSYAQGDPLPIPTFIYWVVSILFVIAVLSYYRKGKFDTV